MNVYNFKGTITLIGQVKNRKGYEEQYIIVTDEATVLVFFAFNYDIHKLISYKIGDGVEIKFSIYSYTSTGSVYETVLAIQEIQHGYIEPKQEEEKTSEHYQEADSDYFRGCLTEGERKRRYRKLTKKYHPDRGGNEEIMKEINKQYNIKQTV